MKKILFTFSFLSVSLISNAQVYKDKNATVEQRVEDVLSKMTIEEKIDYIGGYKDFSVMPLPGLGLPELKMSDGPVGVRNFGKTTAYPAGILAAATWDTALIFKEGQALADDARARGVHILLAPGVNIYRAPMCGRNFEYFGEDPYLSSRMTVAYIKGLQNKKVVATVKHFAGNNQEWDRNNVSSDIDERTLQEIYLPAFKAAVTEAKVGCIMNSYNLLNGIHATQNDHLNNEITKGLWGFDGFIMSDWVATYDGVAAVKGGLDLEMPSAAYMNRANLLPALQQGKISQQQIDDKVRRILRILFRFGFYDNVQEDKSIPLANENTAAVSLDMARSGIVLLKNDNKVLPLNINKIRSVAVIGPNANAYIAGGGSSFTSPFHTTTVLDGIKNISAGKFAVNYVAGMPSTEMDAAASVFYLSKGSNTAGLKTEYFNNQELKGEPVKTVTEAKLLQSWGDAGPEGVGVDHFSARWTGVVRPLKTDIYRFAVRGDDGYRLWIDDKLVIDEWHDQGPTTKGYQMKLQKGKDYAIRLEFYENGGGAEISLSWKPFIVDFSEAVAAARKADVAIVCIGFNDSNEGEGSDRSFNLPELQDTLIMAIAKANPNTIVILNAGGNVDMHKWIDKVNGLLYAWYPGQEGGTAIAEILFGKINPSGHLPASFEKKWEDNPVFNNYHDTDGDKRVAYKEGLLLGYRYYDTKKIEPRFEFGFGLSYTSFSYNDLKIEEVNGRQQVIVSVTIKNTGNMDGAEVAQLYVHDATSKAMRPYKELKAFQKVFLQKGEGRTITFTLDKNAFSYYKETIKAFGMDAGDFELIIGSSSRHTRFKKTIHLNWE